MTSIDANPQMWVSGRNNALILQRIVLIFKDVKYNKWWKQKGAIAASFVYLTLYNPILDERWRNRETYEGVSAKFFTSIISLGIVRNDVQLI